MINAKNARNFIVHELTLGFEKIAEKDKDREYVLESLKEKITKIAKANVMLIILICFETHEDAPTSDYMKKYTNMILTWVLNVEDL